jgi:type I restriction enzyme, S subunit
MKTTIVQLNSVSKILSGFAFDSDYFTSEQIGMPLIRIRDVGFDSTETFYLGKYSETYRIKKGDFLITMDGEFRIAEWNGPEGLLNQRVCKIDFDETKIDRRFAYYFLPKELRRIEDRTPFVTVKHLSVKKIESIEIPLPPLPIQKKIATILDKADSLRQKDKQLLEHYTTLAQSIFYDIFGDPTSNPKKWKKIDLGNLVEFPSALVDPTEGTYSGMKHVGGDNIATDGRLFGLKTAAELGLRSGKFLFDESHVLYNKIRPYLNKVAMPNFRGLCSADMYPIRAGKDLTREFLYKILRSDDFLNFAATQSRRANIPKINREELSSYEMIVPDLNLQKRFSRMFLKIQSIKSAAEQTSQKSETLFQALLQKAFKGELVKDP